MLSLISNVNELSCVEGRYVQRAYQRVTYVIQMYNFTLLKPNDIEYVLYSTGKLHK